MNQAYQNKNNTSSSKESCDQSLYYQLTTLSFFHSSNRCDSILHAETHATTVLLGIGGGFALHLLADLDVDIEELGDAAVQADGFALVEIAFAVVGGDALLGAGLGETVSG